MRRIGSILLFISSILLAAYVYKTYHQLKALPQALLNRDAIRLLYSAMLALPFVIVRAIYSVVYAFDSSPGLNPIGGPFAVKIVMIFLVQLLAALLVVYRGIVTRNIRREEERLRFGTGYRPATRGEPRHGGQSERRVMGDYSIAPEQPAKSVNAERAQRV